MSKRIVNITRIKKDQVIKTHDTVVIEAPVEIIVNSKSLVEIICLPEDLKELTVGFLYSIGLINAFNDIEEIKVNILNNTVTVLFKEDIEFNIDGIRENPVGRVIDTSCGISSPWRTAIKNILNKKTQSLKNLKDLKINKEIIFKAIIEMQKNTDLFRETGGCHGAAIFSREGNLITVKEDIGRHNAIDKVIGELLIKSIPFQDVFLTSTGRVTGDSVLKAVRANIPIVASLSAAIESGIRIAFAYGITLIGFVRGSRMNIYTHPERINNL
ncbi:MAG: formate dehydrogenase accessory sulfurtransferase FdhD [Promethearchaeota archaeon]